MNFASDNVYGVHPSILAALADANSGTAASYAGDEWSKKSEEKLSEVFGRDVRAFLVTTGTAANGLSLASIAPSHGAVICHAEAHISCDECNSPEFFTGGAKILGLRGPGGKITPPMIEKTLKGFIRGEHDPKPAAVSIANVSELGTVYSPAEVKAISALTRPRGMKLHMDGSRFANAVVGLGCAPADVTWKAGVDVMSFGASKNGAMLLEAVVFFDVKLAEDFRYRRMRSGQLVSKGRYLGAQMLAYLKDGLWLDNARRANALARQLAAGFQNFPAIRVPNPVQANEVFAIMPEGLYERLLGSGVICGRWITDTLGNAIGPKEAFVRFVLSFATPEDSLTRLLNLLDKLPEARRALPDGSAPHSRVG